MPVVRLTDLDAIDVAGVHWRPLRRALGVTAFKTNAYSADAGEQLIEPHTEASSGQEEMYVLVAGAATFDHDGEEVQVEAGSVVFYPDPGMHRGAKATRDGTFAMAVGNAAGAAGPVSAWEHRFAAAPQAAAGDLDGAYATIAEALTDHPDDGATHYDLAAVRARQGRIEEALEHWRQAVRLEPRVRDWAADDDDLDAIRDRL